MPTGVTKSVAITTTYVFPASKTAGEVSNITQLSILDCSVQRFAPTSGTWIYPSAPSLTTPHLLASLAATLTSYPHFAGQLRRSAAALSVTSGNRFGLEIEFGSERDPGVAVVERRCEARLEEIRPLPDAEERSRGGSGVWDATEASAFPWGAEVALAGQGNVWEGKVGSSIGLVRFGCGALCITVSFAHPLADADTLSQFVRSWSRVSAALLAGASPPLIAATFDPSALNSQTGTLPDPDLLALAHSAPLHRFDWQAPNPQSDSTNAWIAHSSQACPEFTEQEAKWRGAPLPWDEWDLSAPVRQMHVRFSPNEISRINKSARASSPTGGRTSLSTLDALLAHVWQATARARLAAGLTRPDDAPIFLDMSMGVRSRMEPPLSATTLGSPIFLAPVTFPTAATLVAATLGEVAAAIRQEVSRYNGRMVRALLHEWQWKVDGDGSRRWDTFLGRRHLLTTSWLGLGVWDIDFGTGKPVETFPNMPGADGCVCLADAPPVDDVEGGKAASSISARWHAAGATVIVMLQAEVAHHFVADQGLKAFA